MRIKHLLMSEAGGADGGGAADNAGAPGGEGGGSVLSAGGQTIAINELIPEKYRVSGEDGAFNLEASTRKLAESYGHLEKRLGGGDAPPKTVEEYSLEGGLPEGFEVDEVMKDPITQSFLKRCHAKGMTNAQVQDVLGFALSEWAPQLMQGTTELDQSEAVSALREGWKSDQDFSQNIQSAYRAFHAFADPGDVGSIDSIGNNPVVVRLLANIGRELGEDTAANTGGIGGSGGESIETLLSSEAYTNTGHPEHAAVSKRVQSYYAKKYAQS